MILLLELGVQLVGVGIIQIDQRRFRGSLLHLTQAAARGLQNHVFGAVSLLGENDACQAAAVPALLADLHQQHDPNVGNGAVQGVKLHLAVRRLGVLLIPLVEFENHIR